MKNLIRKLLNCFIKVESKQVYCLRKNKYVQANYWLLFGVYTGVSYTDVKPLNT